MSFDSSTHAGVHARRRPASRPDPLGGLRNNLAAALALLEGPAVTALAALGRERGSRLGHALEATRRELRRALATTGAGADPA